MPAQPRLPSSAKGSRFHCTTTPTRRIVSEIEAASEPFQAEMLDFVLFVKARAGSAHENPAAGHIRRTPGFCGGEACIGMSRVAVRCLGKLAVREWVILTSSRTIPA